MPREANSSGPPAGSAKAPLLPRALTEAGRIADFHAEMRRSLEADNLTAAEARRDAAFRASGALLAAESGPPAKPSKTRARAAREQALLDLSLAQKRRMRSRPAIPSRQRSTSPWRKLQQATL